MRVSVDAQQPSALVLARAAELIADHGVVALPTETFYGLAASALDRQGCERIFRIKGRASTKALPCIVSGQSQLSRLASEIPPAAVELGARFWPGPLTLVLEARPEVAARSDEGTVAVRVSSLPLARKLAAVAGPITATSANVSGRAPATTAREVEAQLGGAVDLILDGGATRGGLPSTIVDVSGGDLRLVREGVIPFDDIVHDFEW